MRLLELFSFSIVLLCAGCTKGFVGSPAKINTPQATIESIFNTIKENDTTAFKTMLATEKDYESFVRISQMRKKEDTVLVSSYAHEQFKKNSSEQSIRQFYKVRIDGMANGMVNWEKAIFARAFFDNTGQSNNNEPIQVMYPKAEFTYGDYVGVIHVGYRLIKAERGWVVGSLQKMEFQKMVWMPNNIK